MSVNARAPAAAAVDARSKVRRGAHAGARAVSADGHACVRTQQSLPCHLAWAVHARTGRPGLLALGLIGAALPLEVEPDLSIETHDSTFGFNARASGELDRSKFASRSTAAVT